ncbi:MAG TPA: NAD(P)/FAD-dependent oxidoreductase [Microlunatus sp.]|nr:NAD(P)/FAD-dependent oxidoreductase [Microlunatus sp.]
MVRRAVIVGAGAAGLAVAAELRRHRVDFDLLEQGGTIGVSWRGRYDSLQLHTVRQLSGLPGATIPRRCGSWVRRDDFVAYLQRYARDHDITPRLGVEVQAITRSGHGWDVHTTERTYGADAVVVATGLSRSPHLPDWPGRDTFTGSLQHTAAYREPSPYAGGRVLVVGAGNSAAEIALELTAVADEVELSIRTPPNIVRRAVLGVPSQVLGISLGALPEPILNRLNSLVRRLSVPDLREYGLPSPPGDGFSQFLRSRTVPILDHGFVAAIRDGRIRVVPEIARIDGPAVQLVDGSTRRPTAIVAGTGYRPDLRGLVGDLGVLDPAGHPLVHGVHTHPDAAGLYFVGLEAVLSGLLFEIGHEARAVGRAIAQAQPATSPAR